MRKKLILIASLLYLVRMQTSTAAEPVLLQKTASKHAMQYFVSLPKNWRADRSWPIVIAVEAAEKEFKENAKRFAEARGDLPFIIVTPINVTNGNAGQRDPAVYPYSVATWDAIAKDGICNFDINGLLNVLQDVRREYHGEEHVYLTGFEAGAHLVWAMTFRHPEQLAAAAPIAGNYRGRCMEDGKFSDNPARNKLPIHAMQGQLDAGWGPGSSAYAQWLDAKTLAQAHGYRNISETAVPDKVHAPMPEAVLEYFASLLPTLR